jgi:hypothetical protein
MSLAGDAARDAMEIEAEGKGEIVSPFDDDEARCVRERERPSRA